MAKMTKVPNSGRFRNVKVGISEVLGTKKKYLYDVERRLVPSNSSAAGGMYSTTVDYRILRINMHILYKNKKKKRGTIECVRVFCW